MANMTRDEKMKMMRKMPLMMQDLDSNLMEIMVDTMMPTMMNVMEQKGIEMFQMMKMMCHNAYLSQHQTHRKMIKIN